MSEERNAKPVLDEDGNDTGAIVEEKDPAAESTGEQESYQNVPETGKSIGPDGKVYTQNPQPPPRPISPGALTGPGGMNIHFPDINIGDISVDAPDLTITEPLLNVEIPNTLVDIDIPQPLVDIDVTEPLMSVDIPQPLIDIDIPQPLVDIDMSAPLIQADIPDPLISIDGPLVVIPDFPEIPPFPEWPEIPPFPELPEIPENFIHIEGPIIDLPEEELIKIVGPLLTIPNIPENLVNIVGPMVELPPYPEDGLINIGDITMPEVVGINVPLDEIPKPVQYGVAGGMLLIGLGMALFGASKAKGLTKGLKDIIK